MKTKPLFYLPAIALIASLAITCNALGQSTLKGSPKVKIENVKLTHKYFTEYELTCTIKPLVKEPLGKIIVEIEQKADGSNWIKGKDIEVNHAFLKESQPITVVGELMRIAYKGKYKITVKENGIAIGMSIMDLPAVDIEITSINFNHKPQDSVVVTILGSITNNSDLNLVNLSTGIQFLQKRSTDPDNTNSWKPAGGPYPINIPAHEITTLTDGIYKFRPLDSEIVDVKVRLWVSSLLFLEKTVQLKSIRKIQIKTHKEIIR